MKITPRLIPLHDDCLCELSSDNTWHIHHGVGVAEEARWVCLNLADVEPITGVETGGIADDTGHEWPAEAPCATSRGIWIIADWAWVGEGQSGWARGSLDGFVNVCCGVCSGFVVTGNTEEGDVLRCISV